MQVRHKHMRYAAIIVLMISLAGCSTKVAPESIEGTYLASFPFGNATLVLEKNGTFVQKVTINGQAPGTARGSWSFDPSRSKITLRDAMAVVDGFGHLETNWRSVDDLIDQPVERLWFKVKIEVSNSYPYVKK